MRGHGLSDKPEPPYEWARFGDDLVALMRAMGLKAALGVGHSKGGYALVRAAALAPELFSGLLLVDPVILPREAYLEVRWSGEHFASRRRDAWSSPSEMFEAFCAREPFSRWQERVLRDYCGYGLGPNAAGVGYVLACPPRVEAAVYQAAVGGGDIYDEIARVDVPVRVLRARPRDPTAAMDMTSSPTAPDLAARCLHCTDGPAPQFSHFIPMEAPGVVARELRALELQVDARA